MRLIDATPFSFEKVVIPDGTGSFMRGYGLGAKHVCDEIDAAPTVEAVPLDKLCEWLGNFANPCKIGIRCYYPDDNDYDCMPTVECWRYVLTKWMEGKDGTD